MKLNNLGSILPITIVSMFVMMIIGLVCLKMFTMQNILDTYDLTKQRVDYASESAIELAIGYINDKTPTNDNSGGINGGYLYNKTKTSTSGWNILNEKDFALTTNPTFFDTMHPKIKIEKLYCVKRTSVSYDMKHFYPSVYYFEDYYDRETPGYNDAVINGINYFTQDFYNKLHNTDKDSVSFTNGYGGIKVVQYNTIGRSSYTYDRKVYTIYAVASANYKTNMSSCTIYSTRTYTFCVERYNSELDPTKSPQYKHKEYSVMWRQVETLDYSTN